MASAGVGAPDRLPALVAQRTEDVSGAAAVSSTVVPLGPGSAGPGPRYRLLEDDVEAEPRTGGLGA